MNKFQAFIIEGGRWVGVQETGGNNKGQLVSIFQRHIGGAHGEPWCMSFVQYCAYWVDQYFTESKHRLFPSEHCMTVWRNSPSVCRLTGPMEGSVVIWNYEGTDNGHTGIVRRLDGNHIYTIEGNTGDSSAVVREGDGVFVKRRLLQRSSKSKMQIVGFLNPWP